MPMIPATFTSGMYKFKGFTAGTWSKLKRAFRSSQTVDGDDATAAGKSYDAGHLLPDAIVVQIDGQIGLPDGGPQTPNYLLPDTSGHGMQSVSHGDEEGQPIVEASLQFDAQASHAHSSTTQVEASIQENAAGYDAGHLLPDAIVIQIDGQIGLRDGGPQTPNYLLPDTSGHGMQSVIHGDEEGQPIVEASLQFDAQASHAHSSTTQVEASIQENAPQHCAGIKLAQRNHLKLTETSLTLLMRFDSNNHHHLNLSRNSTILQYFAVGSNFVGYIAFFTSALMCRRSPGLASQILTCVGHAADAMDHRNWLCNMLASVICSTRELRL